MNVFNRLKSDGKFRNKAIIALLIFFIAMNTIPDKKEFVAQSVCDEFNGWGTLETKFKANECIESGCYLSNFIDIGTAEIPGKCYACIPNGKDTTDPIGCCSGVATEKSTLLSSIPIIGGIVTGILGEKELFTCKYVPEEQVCTQSERGVANYVQSMGLFNNNCKMAYYVTLFGGAFMLLLVIGMIL